VCCVFLIINGVEPGMNQSFADSEITQHAEPQQMAVYNLPRHSTSPAPQSVFLRELPSW
jgi:hypothetical protein